MWTIVILVIGILIIATLFDKKEKSEKQSRHIIRGKTMERTKFESVKIGNQVWMSKNLSITNYQNGDPIIPIQNENEWGLKSHNEEMPLCYFPGNDKSKIEKYGVLYNYYVLEDSRGLAPDGWRIPNSQDWNELIEYLGDSNETINKIKKDRGWKSGQNGNGSIGFNAFPTGYLSCDALKGGYKTKYIGNGYMALWWTLNKGEVDKFSKTAIKLSDSPDNNTFGQILLGDDNIEKSFIAELYEQTYLPYNACSVRLIKE